MARLLPWSMIINTFLVSSKHGKQLIQGNTSLARSVYTLPCNTEVPGSSPGGDKVFVYVKSCSLV